MKVSKDTTSSLLAIGIMILIVVISYIAGIISKTYIPGFDADMNILLLTTLGFLMSALVILVLLILCIIFIGFKNFINSITK